MQPQGKDQTCHLVSTGFHYSARMLSPLDKQKCFLWLELQIRLKMSDYLIVVLIAIANQEKKESTGNKNLRIAYEAGLILKKA